MYLHQIHQMVLQILCNYEPTNFSQNIFYSYVTVHVNHNIQKIRRFVVAEFVETCDELDHCSSISLLWNFNFLWAF